MRGVTVIFLHAFATQAHAKELASTQKSDTQDSTDQLTDRLIDKLVDKLLGFQLMTPQRATTFLSSRSASPSALGMTPRVQAAKDSTKNDFRPSRKLSWKNFSGRHGIFLA